MTSAPPRTSGSRTAELVWCSRSWRRSCPESDRQPRAAGEQAQIGTAGTEDSQVVVAERVGNGDLDLLAAQLPDFAAICSGPAAMLS